MSASFDPKKNAANIKKHGVALSEGDGVLSDPLALTVEDTAAQGEQRFVTIGMNVSESDGRRHSPRRDGPRIISVRKPDPRERRDYEEGV